MALDPARAATRLAVRRALDSTFRQFSYATRRADRSGTVGMFPAESQGGTVLVACSGGADSLALLAATVFEGPRLTRRVLGVVVDHGLQEGSAEHTARVVEQMAALGVDETASVRVQVEPGAVGPEAAAREARYVALAQLAEHFGAVDVLLGHTLDDQAETVLLGLARGSGGRSLQGMRRRFHEGGVAFVRPFLELTGAATEAACRADGIAWWSDPHNQDPRFLRPRVRHSVLPVLEHELGPGVAQALARTAGQLREDMDLLDSIADTAYASARRPDGLDLAELGEAATAIVTRCVRRAALDAGAIPSELTHDHVRALLDTRAGKEIQLPGHVTAYADDGVLRFRPTAG